MSVRLFYSGGEAQGNSFKEPGIDRMTVKSHVSETQDDRECQCVNCKILGELFNLDFDE